MTLKRTEWKRKPSTKSAALDRVAGKESKAADKARRSLTQSRPKMTPIRKAARGQDCTMRIDGVCNWNPETTVWAHSNNYRDGKCAGKKARDEEGCFACSSCHSFYDGGYANAGWTRAQVEAKFDGAREESKPILAAMGLIKDGTGSTAIDPAPEHLLLEQ